MKTLDEIKKETGIVLRIVGEDGGSGIIYKSGKPYGSVIWSNGGGWEHVSIAPFNRRLVPSWDDMCKLKDMFFHDDEVVVQYHPVKSEYVNNVSNCLHLWRLTETEMPTPPSFLVGIKNGETYSEVMKEAERYLNEH